MNRQSGSMKIKSSTILEKTKSLKLPERLRNLSITYSDAERMGKWPEKLKSYDDDHAEHSRGEGDWCGMSMHRNGKYCMHKMHRSHIYMVQRRYEVVVAVGGCCGCCW